jgi:hypothetical protein
VGGRRARERVRHSRRETSAEVVAGTRDSTKKAAVSPRRLVSIPYGLLILSRVGELRGQDSNLRPRGYEPRELPGCSTPRPFFVGISKCQLGGVYSYIGWRRALIEPEALFFFFGHKKTLARGGG